MSDAEETVRLIVEELARQGIDEADLSPIFQVGPAYVVMLGDHNREDGFCWCQPWSMTHGATCPGHAIHKDIAH